MTGTTPFERKRLHEAAFDEMLRILREEEPPKPSTKVSASDALPSIAANRHTEPARLSKDVHGELDWIVMKALEKDRNRRYETASSFAADIERHLRDEPVQAGPPSAAYRFRKFARRNKRALATASLFALALLGTVVTLVVSNVIVSEERDAKTIALGEKETALIQAQANKEAADKQRQRAEDNLQLAVNALDQILLRPAEKRLAISRREQGRLLTTDPERQQLESELLEKGAEFYAQFAQRNSADPAAQLNAATAYHWLGYYQHQMGQQEKSLQTYRQGLRFLEGSTLAAQQEDPAYLQTQAELYHSMYLPLFAMKRFAEAEEVTRRGLAMFEKQAAAGGPGRVHGSWRQMIWSNMNLGSLASQAGRNLEAEQAFRKALAISDNAIQALPRNLDLRCDKAKAGELLGAFYANADRLDESIAVWGAVVKEWAKLAEDTGEPDIRWRVAGAIEHIGLLHQKASRDQDAEKKYADALLIWEKLVADTNHPDYRSHLGRNREQAGYLFKKMGRLTEAAAAYQAAITIWDKLVAEFNQPDHRGHLAGSQGALKEIRSLQERQAKDQVKEK
jgi:tetratricopeptide (TPR) repeat protein